MPPGLAVAVPPGLVPTTSPVPSPLSKALQLPMPAVGPSHGDESVESSPETVEMGGNLGFQAGCGLGELMGAIESGLLLLLLFFFFG